MQASTLSAGSNSAPIGIDPGLKPADIAPAFRQFGRVHIPGFLAPASAQTLHHALATETGWRCSTMAGGQALDIPMEQLNAFTPDEAIAFLNMAHAEARDGFNYMFENVRVSDLAERGGDLSPTLRAAYDFLNGPAFLNFIRAVIGDPTPNYVDAQATRYDRGHYLTHHTDAAEGKGRVCAYVLNLTPRWRTDWGGLLNFIDADGHVAEAYSPTWNALNLFRVPQGHAVSCVAPFAGAARLSITGWVRKVDLARIPGRTVLPGLS